jgi:radical SAM superfamily enzyme YgiQ (UPF0313 family)
MSRVLIVNMPFSNLRWPNLGPSLLKAALARRGIGCDMAYLNFDFAERIGLDRYTWIADCFAFVLGGERLFAKGYFPGQLPGDEDYLRDVLLTADPGLFAADLEDYQSIERHVESYLDDCLRSTDWSRYAIVGFPVSFQQTMPSICLARRIKEIRPDVKIIFGGAACEGPMGVELARQFPVIDYVFLGEADLTFPRVVEDVLAGRPVRMAPGVVGRLGGMSSRSVDMSADEHGDANDAMPPDREAEARPPVAALCDPKTFMVRDLDALPYPDFDDYFARLKASPLAAEIDPLLFFETSRGCWWGEKHHCKFCGLNGSTLVYRSKGPKRAIDELRYLVDRYGVHRACSSDNILDHRYFETLLPMLRENRLDLAFVYEMKTNLTRRQVDSLLDAGLGAAQLGIETFATPVLKLAGKGANALQNLQTLKWFSEAGIEVKWNLLYGFPGEDPADYATLAELLPSLYHLAPPLAVGRVRLDRFSPYFEEPARYGIVNPRPNRAFRYVYPFSDESLAELAYYYEYDYADGRDPLDYAAPALAAAETWRELNGTVTLRYWDRPDGVLIITDTRPCAAAFQHRLTGLERQIHLFCDTGRPLKDIRKLAAKDSARNPADARPDEPALRRILDQWLAERLLVFLDGRYLSLAMRAPANGEV